MFKTFKIATVAMLFVMFAREQSFAIDTVSTDSKRLLVPDTNGSIKTMFKGKIRYYGGVGGPAVKLSSYNGHFAFMTGGRGAGIINGGFTIGGSGYGITNSIPLQSENPDTLRTLTMGYGGLELGYVFYPEKILSAGGLLLVGAGAIAWKSQPERIYEQSIFGNDVQFFGVVEPSLYGVLTLFRFLRFNAGVSYRFAYGAESVTFRDRDLCEFSIYTGLLLGKISSSTSLYRRHGATR